MIQIHEDIALLLEERGFSSYYLPPTKIIPSGLNTWSSNGDEIIGSHTIVAVIYYESSTNPLGYKIEGKEKVVAGYFTKEQDYLWILPDYSITVLSKNEMIRRLNLLIFI